MPKASRSFPLEKLSVRFLEEGKEHYGIVIATRRNVYELGRKVARFLELQTAKGVKNQLWYI